MGVMLKNVDTDVDGNVSRDEAYTILQNEEALLILEGLGICVGTFYEMLDMKYNSLDSVRIHDIMQLLIESQGSRPACVRDLARFFNHSRYHIKENFKEIRSF